MIKSHKFDSDQRAGREHAKISEASTRNSKLGAGINGLLGNGDGYGTEREEKPETPRPPSTERQKR